MYIISFYYRMCEKLNLACQIHEFQQESLKPVPNNFRYGHTIWFRFELDLIIFSELTKSKSTNSIIILELKYLIQTIQFRIIELIIAQNQFWNFEIQGIRFELVELNILIPKKNY